MTSPNNPETSANLPIAPAILENTTPDIEQAWRTYGDTFAITEAGLRRVITADPDHVHTIYTDPNYTQKGPLYGGVALVQGEGILVTHGERWQESRRVVNPAFHRKQLHGMTDRMAATGQAYVEELAERAGKDGIVIDIQEEMTKLTLDTLTTAMFGKDVIVTDKLDYPTLSKAFELSAMLSNSAEIPPSEAKAFDNVTTRVGAVIGNLIKQAQSEGPVDNLVSMLAHSTVGDTGRPLSSKAMHDELTNIMFAGHETTALTITWLCKLATANTEIFPRIRQEADNVFGSSLPGFSDIPNLAYTQRAIQETLRVCPTVPMTARTAQQDTYLGDTKVNAGDVVLPYLFGMHRNTKHWERPETFYPDHFLPEAVAMRDRRAYRPFAAGGRMCAGEGFARTELALHSALLAKNFNITPLPNNAVPQSTITLRPSEPIRAHVVPRRTA